MRDQIRSLAIGLVVAALVFGIAASGIMFLKRPKIPEAGPNEMQRRILENWLARHPFYGYVSGDSGLNGEPYACSNSTGSSFATGDFNEDGHQDFAVILRVRGGPSHVVVFNGPLASDMQEPAYEADANDLGFFASSAVRAARLYVETCGVLGPDTSPGFSLTPRGNTYVRE